MLPVWVNVGGLLTARVDGFQFWDIFVREWLCTHASMNKCRAPVLRVLKNNSESSGSLAL